MTIILSYRIAKVVGRATIFLFALVLSACTNKSEVKSNKKLDSLKIDTSSEAENIFRNCIFSNKDFGYKIDSCNCGDILTKDDTIFINLFQADGGEIQGHLLQIDYPICDNNSFILMKHQNRYFVGSMGPDPVLEDWILYNSAFDTIYFNKKKKGFYIDTIPYSEQEKFPQFDTLDFFKAYKRAVGDNMNLDYVPDMAKNALYRDYLRSKENIKETLMDSAVELHRIFLILKQGNSTKKVIVFTYGHFG